MEGCIHTSLVIPSLVNAASVLLNTVVILPMNTVLVWIVAYLCCFSFRQSHGCAWPEYEVDVIWNYKKRDKRYPQNFKWRRGEAHTHTHTPSSTAPVKQNNKPPPVFRRTTGSRHLAVYSLGASRGGCSVEYTFRYPPHENHCGELVDGRLVSPGHDIVPIQRLTVRATCEIRSW